MLKEKASVIKAIRNKTFLQGEYEKRQIESNPSVLIPGLLHFLFNNCEYIEMYVTYTIMICLLF